MAKNCPTENKNCPSEFTKGEEGNTTLDRYIKILDEVVSDGIQEQSAIKIGEKFGRDVDSLQKYWNDKVSVSEHSSHKKIYDAIFNTALTNLPILLSGASGCGKTHIAKTIFKIKAIRFSLKNTSESESDTTLRTEFPKRFCEQDCTGLRGENIQSVLFGHVRGAFTGANADKTGILEIANGGVLFLDEIGELDLVTQAMLLKAIEQKQFTKLGGIITIKIDFHLICGTNRDLKQMISDGTFREDLYYRICPAEPFTLPSLEQRFTSDEFDDIFASVLKSVTSTNKNLQGIDFEEEAKSRFREKSNTMRWQSNMRGFRSAVENMCWQAVIKGLQEVTVDVVEKLKEEESVVSMPEGVTEDSFVNSISDLLKIKKENAKKFINLLDSIFRPNWQEVLIKQVNRDWTSSKPYDKDTGQSTKGNGTRGGAKSSPFHLVDLLYLLYCTYKFDWDDMKNHIVFDGDASQKMYSVLRNLSSCDDLPEFRKLLDSYNLEASIRSFLNKTTSEKSMNKKTLKRKKKNENEQN